MENTGQDGRSTGIAGRAWAAGRGPAIALALVLSIVRGVGDDRMATAIEFVDRRAIEHTHFLERRVTPVRRYKHNPIIPGACDIATVLRGRDGVIRLWYKTMVPIPG